MCAVLKDEPNPQALLVQLSIHCTYPNLAEYRFDFAKNSSNSMHQATLQVGWGERPRVTCHTAANPAVCRRKHVANDWTSHALWEAYTNLATKMQKKTQKLLCLKSCGDSIPPFTPPFYHFQSSRWPSNCRATSSLISGE